jgi:phage FluMu protein Com
MQPVRGVTFGGPLESMEDPVLFEFVTPRIFGEFAMQVVDPVRFVIGYYGQAAGSMDNDQTLNWIKGKFFMSVKAVIGQVCSQQQKSLLNLGGMTLDISQAILQRAPNLEEIGVRITDLGNFNINFNQQDMETLREANKERGAARRNVSIARDVAAAKQVELDQQFNQDARYVQQLAGNYQNYAAGQAMIGAGQGLAQGPGQGGGNPAFVGVGLGMGGLVAGQMGQTLAAGGQIQVRCPNCHALNAETAKFCNSCGQALAAAPAPAGATMACPKCGTQNAATAKFCTNCGQSLTGGGTPAPAQ